jgi:hypothetical protein
VIHFIGDCFDGRKCEKYAMDLQQRCVIQCYVLRQKCNAAIQTKLSLVYGKNALCQRAVGRSAARFWNERTSVEDDDRPGRPSSDSLPATVSGYLNRNLYASCRDIAKDVFIPRTTIFPFLDEMGLRFFVARWGPHERSAKVKAKGVEICREMLDVLE